MPSSRIWPLVALGAASAKAGPTTATQASRQTRRCCCCGFETGSTRRPGGGRPARAWCVVWSPSSSQIHAFGFASLVLLVICIALSRLSRLVPFARSPTLVHHAPSRRLTRPESTTLPTQTRCSPPSPSSRSPSWVSSTAYTADGLADRTSLLPIAVSSIARASRTTAKADFVDGCTRTATVQEGDTCDAICECCFRTRLLWASTPPAFGSTLACRDAGMLEVGSGTDEGVVAVGFCAVDVVGRPTGAAFRSCAKGEGLVACFAAPCRHAPHAATLPQVGHCTTVCVVVDVDGVGGRSCRPPRSETRRMASMASWLCLTL